MTSRWRPADWEAIRLDRAALELTDFAAVDRRFHAEYPDGVIHCAAMSRSPDCQREPERARLCNVEVTRHLAALFAGKPMIFLSTDLVFDGLAAPYREDARLNPLSVYGETKAEAEAIVGADPAHLVVRTSLNHGISPTGDRGFNEELERAWVAGRRLSLFTDEYRMPLGAEVTARALWELLDRRVTGIVHVAGSDRLSRWEIGKLVAGSDERRLALIEAGSLRDYRGAARAPDTSMDLSRAGQVLRFRLPGYAEWLGRA
jgi:dTDP-4-dehydrorhamnose reductase